MNSNCIWQTDGDGYRCEACGTWRRAKVRRVCRSEDEQQQQIRQHHEAKRKAREEAKAAAAITAPRPRLPRVLRWLIAMLRFARESIKARRLLVREEREYLRVRSICEACEEWQPNLEQCRICGCGGRSKVVLLNKLRIETEKCPQGKW